VAAPSLPADVRKLREQLLRDQAPSARTRTNYFDPSVFSSRYGRPYSSRRLPISTLLEMRTDAILRFAQLTALVSIFTAKWHIECSNARKAAFLDHALRRIIGRLIIQYFECWNFGWQALVKEFGLMSPSWQYIDRDAKGGPRAASVWDGGAEVPALVWEPFVPLRPQTVAPVWTAGGAFNGIAIAKSGASGAYSVPVAPLMPGDIIDVPHEISASFDDRDEHQKKINVEHSLWVVNERDGQWGSVWGYPRLGYAFKYWWSGEMALGILNRSVERKGDPTIVVTYPSGSSRVNDEDVPNQTIALQIGESARSGSVLAVPSEVWGEDMATANQSPKWHIDYLKAEEQFDKLLAVLDHMDTMKFRSMFVSELALAEGSGGTSSRNVAAVTGERSAEAQFFAEAELDEIINRYMIPQLADANFPELKSEPARKVTQAFGENEATLAADILRSFANADPTSLPLDLPALLERFQIASLEGKDLAKWEQRLIKRAEMMSKPTPTEAKSNGKAGVTDTGFYYDAPEHIALEGDEALLASLPKTRHYSDRAVLAQARLVRKLWHDLLAEQYEDFAKYVAKADVTLADDRSKGAAALIVSGWRFTGVTAAKTVKAVAVALARILARAGALELASSRIDAKVWDTSSKHLDEWVRDNAAALVRSVDETTRQQISTFLASEIEAGRGAKEIASNLRAHFAEFPGWRADLIAREETRRAYNAGTLFAAEAAGVKQVQALDGQGPGPTDEDCARRHGRLFSVADAWMETESEHVRGTLSWRIIPAEVQLSFARLSSSEMGEVAARFDQEERTIYLAEDVDSTTEGRYLERAVDWLIASA